MKKVLRYLKPYWFFALLGPLAMVGEVLADLIQPTLMSVIVDEGVAKSNIALIKETGIAMLIVVALGCMCGALSSVFSNFAAQKFSCDLRNATYQRVMNLSIAQTDSFTTGSLITRVTNDITMVQNFVSMMLRMFVRAPLSFIGGIIMAIRLDVRFSIVLAVALPLQFFLIFVVLKKASPLFGKVQRDLDEVNSVVQENVTGARVVKAYRKEKYEINRFEDANETLSDTTCRVQCVMARLSPLMMIVMQLSVIAIIYIGNLQVQAGAMQVGKIMAAVTYITTILHFCMMLSNMFQSVSRASACARRIEEVLDSVPEIIEGERTQGEERGTVRMEHVSFRYPNTKGKYVLQDLNFEIKKGEYVAILGATGEGKSSLIHLIHRFYDANEGTVYVNGCDVRSYRFSALRDRIGLVLQKSQLFAGTIEENIRFGKGDATFDEIRHAASIAQADEFIAPMVNGYQTSVSEKGMSLSGGQKQRISIARAILRRPEIMILDDSTSALDLQTEAQLRNALRHELPDTTMIVIAQRIASVMHADKIIVLDQGKIESIGNHDFLMTHSPVYHDIYQSQLGNGGVIENE
jgi:ATP-binding cassette subfamily B protein